MRSTIFSDSPSLFIGSWCALQGLLWQNLRRSCDSSTRFLLPRVLLLRICTRSFMIEKRGHTLWSLYSECCWLLIEFWDSRGSAHARGCMCACVCVCVCVYVCVGVCLFVCLSLGKHMTYLARGCSTTSWRWNCFPSHLLLERSRRACGALGGAGELDRLL